LWKGFEDYILMLFMEGRGSKKGRKREKIENLEIQLGERYLD